MDRYVVQTPQGNYDVGPEAPASNAADVTYSNTANLSPIPRALWVGAAGNVSVIMAGGQTVTFPGVPAGTLLPIRVQCVRVTNTTVPAGNIEAIW